MAIAAHVEPVAPLFCSKLEAGEAKRPNSESVEEMTHLSRTAFDAKQSTLRKLQKNTGRVGCKTILGINVLIIVLLHRQA